MKTRYLIEYAGFVGGHYDFQTFEGAVPETVEVMHGDILDACDNTAFVQLIRVTQIDNDVPPQDITQDVLTALISDWDFIDDPSGLTIFDQATDASADRERFEQQRAAA